MAFANNVTRLLDGKDVTYTLHTYEYRGDTHGAVDVAHAIGLPAEQVFKTLVTAPARAGGKPALVVLPGTETLDLKRFAAAIGAKKVRMASRADAERMTGLLAGGISPLALINRGFDIYLDGRAIAFDRIYVSAGERGVQVGLPVADLVRLTGARTIDLQHPSGPAGSG